jgi:hypothetical protein
MAFHQASDNVLTTLRDDQPGFLERRKSARYVPVLDLGHLGWWDGADFRSAPVRLLNLSLGGVALRCSEQPPEERSVWISIAGLERAGWIAADVLEVRPLEQDGPMIRLQFPAPLAYEVFRASVWGFPNDEPLATIQAAIDEPEVGTVAC